MAFVSSFAGVPVQANKVAVCTRANISMSADVSRREILTGMGVAAALAAAPALAAGGDSPKQSFFGGDSQSSPFTYTMKQGTPIYDPKNEEEINFHKKVVAESKARLEKTNAMIAEKSWDEVRGELSLQMKELRHSSLKLIDLVAEDKKKATKAYDEFKKNVEALDLAARFKKQDEAKRYKAAATKALDSFAAQVGI
eukprot:CAMPEP_0184700606 /NCGR_PEP_ID=MMETSP0313-20130426/14687_1 /TAXON_ID=2792 /ORGANISM="Porphyridium aerugineum, Strain SAG 1380-2" /LENGTH=196 /DNA_ID=CAMNT_0027160361 /DNA_START=107 /DNA_END=697 /DNA_ORIENTATION=-